MTNDQLVASLSELGATLHDHSKTIASCVVAEAARRMRALSDATKEIEALQNAIRNIVYTDDDKVYVTWRENVDVRMRMPDVASRVALDQALSPMRRLPRKAPR